MLQTADLAAARRTLADQGFVSLPNLFDERLLRAVLRQSARAEFVFQDLGVIGSRLIERSDVIGGRLRRLLSRPRVRQQLASGLGLRAIGAVQGALTRFDSIHGSHLDWHDDLGTGSERRLLGFAINLGGGRPDGGAFELRDAHSRALLLRHRFQRPGETLFFRIAPDLEHRVEPLRGPSPRIVFSGWLLAAEPI